MKKLIIVLTAILAAGLVYSAIWDTVDPSTFVVDSGHHEIGIGYPGPKVALLIVPSMLAAPGDMRIVLFIPAKDVPAFTAQFLAKCSMPLIEDPAWVADPNNIGPAPMIPEYTVKGWAQQWLWQQLDRARWQGEQLLALRGIVRDRNMIKKE